MRNKKKGFYWSMLITLTIISVMACVVFFFTNQHSISVAEEVMNYLEKEQEKSNSLQEKLLFTEQELEILEIEYRRLLNKLKSGNNKSEENESDKSDGSELPEAESPVKQPENNNDKKERNDNGKTAYLTFDDGPSENTISILNTLKTFDIRATFFVTGNNSTGDDGIYQRIVDEGHVLGNHTNTHDFNRIYQSETAFMKDFLELEKIIKRKTGIKTDIMRFPGGSSSQMAQQVSGYNIIVDKLIDAVKSKGYDYFDWNVTSGDGTASISAEKIIENVMEGANRVNGDIVVLFHDSKPKRSTAEALPTIIRNLKEKGYKFEPLTKGAVNVKHR